MARKASGPVEDAGRAADNPDADEVFDAAPDQEGGRTTGIRPAVTFDGAYADYFRSVCRGQRAQQVEMQRVWCDYASAAHAAMVTHDGAGLQRAQRAFQEEWARVSDPARFHESVREAFDAYQQKISHAFAATDLTRLPPGALEAIGRGVSHVAAHRMGAGV
jgi:hypothetical protein